MRGILTVGESSSFEDIDRLIRGLGDGSVPDIITSYDQGATTVGPSSPIITTLEPAGPSSAPIPGIVTSYSQIEPSSAAPVAPVAPTKTPAQVIQEASKYFRAPVPAPVPRAPVVPLSTQQQLMRMYAPQVPMGPGGRAGGPSIAPVFLGMTPTQLALLGAGLLVLLGLGYVIVRD